MPKWRAQSAAERASQESGRSCPYPYMPLTSALSGGVAAGAGVFEGDSRGVLLGGRVLVSAGARVEEAVRTGVLVRVGDIVCVWMGDGELPTASGVLSGDAAPLTTCPQPQRNMSMMK